MGYQYIENFKNARECIIREYEEEDVAKLPDERYNLRLVYYDQKQLKALRKAYTKQIEAMEKDVMHLWDVCNNIYIKDRDEKDVDDWQTLSDRMLNPKKKRGLFSSKNEEEPDDRMRSAFWNEIGFIQPKETIVGQSNPTYEARLDEIQSRFPLMQQKLKQIFHDQNEETRQILEARLKFLQEQFDEFTNQINPYHVQPGLLLDIDIISIKKKKTTMMNMANVINEFLYSVSRGFTDQPTISTDDLTAMKYRSFENISATIND
jgi:hypothetical protein